MSIAIRSFPKEKQRDVVARRLANGTKELVSAERERRKPILGLGYWGAVAARNRGM